MPQACSCSHIGTKQWLQQRHHDHEIQTLYEEEAGMTKQVKRTHRRDAFLMSACQGLLAKAALLGNEATQR